MNMAQFPNLSYQQRERVERQGIDEDDMYRDVDTLQRFLKIIQASDSGVEGNETFSRF